MKVGREGSEVGGSEGSEVDKGVTTSPLLERTCSRVLPDLPGFRISRHRLLLREVYAAFSRRFVYYPPISTLCTRNIVTTILPIILWIIVLLPSIYTFYRKGDSTLVCPLLSIFPYTLSHIRFTCLYPFHWK